jgi:hypothetical protein
MEQTKKQESLCEEQVDLGMVVPPCVTHDEHRRDVQEEQVDTVTRDGESAVDNVELKEHLEQASSKPSTEIQLRRSTRERQPSRRYSVDEYVLFSDGRDDESQILYIWTPQFAFVKPLVLVISNIFLQILVF